MSNFTRPTKNPKTGQIERAEWLDDFFGKHEYGVRFPDGTVYRPEEVEKDSQINEAGGVNPVIKQ